MFRRKVDPLAELVGRLEALGTAFAEYATAKRKDAEAKRIAIEELAVARFKDIEAATTAEMYVGGIDIAGTGEPQKGLND